MTAPSLLSSRRSSYSPSGLQAQPLFSVLYLCSHRDVAGGLGRSLQAFGCRVEALDSLEAFTAAIRDDFWDAVLVDVPTVLPAEALERAREAQPHAGLWFLTVDGELPGPMARFAGGAGVKVFRAPVPPDALFQALVARSSSEGEWYDREEAQILTVHAEPLFCEGLLEFLAMEGHRARSARNGTDALAEAGRQFYHMALVDTGLPDVAAWDLAARLHEVNPDLVVILLADFASLDAVLNAMRADVFDYLLKPLDAFSFRRTIRKALEKQKMSLQIRSLLEGLREANGELFRLNEMKSKFLRVVTHDLRTPLTALKGYAQALAAGLVQAEQYAACFGTMVRESQQLEHLISDLMDFASIEAGKMRFEERLLDPVPVFEGVLFRFQGGAQKKGVRLSGEGIDARLPEVRADPRRLDQLLSNLVSNALKHTPAGGSVTVRVRRRGGELEVRVEDTGAGLAEEHLSRVFEEFYQVESSPQKKDGLGLGLVICREIVQRHGGRIGAESPGPGKGATFWFTLPLSEGAH